MPLHHNEYGGGKRNTVRSTVTAFFLEQRRAVLLGLIVLFFSTAACVLLYWNDNGSLIYFGDAVSHIVRARQFIDSQTPGLLNIGTVWLPMPHFLLIPFIASDQLFYSGLAGAALGIPLLIGTAVLLFAILRMLTGSSPIAFLVALLFGLNPNIIYISLTPMNEISLIFFVVLGGYALLKWHRDDRLLWIVLSSLAVLCATMCRYEAWLLAPFLSVITVRQGFIQWKRNRSSAALAAWSVSVIPWLGIIFWLAWNYFHYGSAVKFAQWTYEVGTSAVRLSLRGDPMALLRIVVDALIWIFGPLMIGAGLLMLFSVNRLSARRDILMVMLYFLVPPVFVFTAVLLGFVQMDQWWWNWRFVLSSGPFLAVAVAVGFQEMFQRTVSRYIRFTVLLLFCVFPFVQMSVPSVGVAVYRDAFKSYTAQSGAAAAMGREVQRVFSGGTIALMTGYGTGQRIMLSSHLPLSSFTVKYFPEETGMVVTDRYIILGKERTADAEEFSLYWMEQRGTLLRTYSVCREDSFFVLLKSIDENSAIVPIP